MELLNCQICALFTGEDDRILPAISERYLKRYLEEILQGIQEQANDLHYHHPV